jgi:hypothetical protein
MLKKQTNIFILNSLLLLGLIAPIYSVPIEIIPSNGLIYPIHVACECDYNIYVNGQMVKPVGIVKNWDGTDDGMNVTNIFNPVIFEPNPNIIAFHGFNSLYPTFTNGFVMDMNHGKDYTKHNEWKCKYFDTKVDGVVPLKWMNYDYDDSGWGMAVSYGMNYQNNSFQIFDHERDGIHLNAEWLWSGVNSNSNIYCRRKQVNSESYYVETNPPTTVQTLAPHTTVQTSAPHVTVQTSAPHTTVQTLAPHTTVQTSAPHTTVQTSAPHTTVQTLAPHTTVQTSAPQTTVQTLAPHTTVQT